MARRTALNPDGTGYQVGANVRVERGLTPDASGGFSPDSVPVWVVFRKVDTKADKDTTYDYRYEPVAEYKEQEPGECPDAAFERADKLAGEE